MYYIILDVGILGIKVFLWNIQYQILLPRFGIFIKKKVCMLEKCKDRKTNKSRVKMKEIGEISHLKKTYPLDKCKAFLDAPYVFKLHQNCAKIWMCFLICM